MWQSINNREWQNQKFKFSLIYPKWKEYYLHPIDLKYYLIIVKVLTQINM